MQTEKTKTLEKYREQARAYMDDHQCRWSEACLAIKRKYPESRSAFGAPAKLENKIPRFGDGSRHPPRLDIDAKT